MTNSNSLDMTALNALPYGVATIDESGALIDINSHWAKFAVSNGYNGSFQNLNYFNICERADGVEMPQARAVGKGIKDVIAGKAKVFEDVYPCHSPTEKRWFKLIAAPFRGGATISHIDLTKEGTSGVPIDKWDTFNHLIHDIKNPLNLISGFAQILEFSKLTKEDISNYVRDTQSAVGQITNIISEVLANQDPSHIDRSGDEDYLNVLSSIEDLIEPSKRAYPDSTVDISCEGDSSLFLKVSPLSFKNIMANLLSNAIKYNRPSGRVKITVSCNSSGGVIICVEDTGIGIPADEIGHVFSPNIRASNSQNVEGSGVGLHGVYTKVTQLDGVIRVDSKINEGTLFEVTFPSYRCAYRQK